MAKYIFILGHSPGLSAWEILKTSRSFFGNYNLLYSSPQALIFEAEKTVDFDNYLHKLGGTIKIGIQDGPIINLPNKDFDSSEIQDYIITELVKTTRQEKIKYGFSVYAAGQEKLWQKKFNQLGLEVKRRLKLQGKKARYLVSREAALSSVIVQKEKLVSEGGDFIFCLQGHKLFLGRTVAVQDFSDYAERDYGRPGRDSFSGMLPVKLAKILINISGALPAEAILDPFCGSGTILTEALIMGFKNINGTDNSQPALANAKNNINWLLKKFNIDQSDRNIFLDKKSVEDLPSAFAAKSIQAIITEPYLGSPQKSRANYDFRIVEMKKIENLYFQAFHNFFQVLKPGGVVVIIWPAYSLAGIRGNNRPGGNTEQIFLSENLLEKILRIGFVQERPDNVLISIDRMGKFITKRGSVLYFRPGQRVLREIFIFKKNA